jgi:hypothetical protein
MLLSSKAAVWVSGVLVAIIALSALLFFTRQKPRLVAGNVEAHVSKVITAEMLGKISGAYWENEMVKQFNQVSNNPVDRIEFFKGIVFYCELDTLRATSFVELVGKDAGSLRKALITFEGGPRFQELSTKQREQVGHWIKTLDVIEQQNAEIKSTQ